MHLHQAQQPRSRKSQERYLDAAARLLEQNSWDSVSIADIAAEAGMSVGGFYARFKSKDALLHVLHERYESRRTEYFNAFLEARGPEQMLPQRVSALVNAVANWMHGNRNVLRTLLLRFWSEPHDFEKSFGEQLEDHYAGAVVYLVGDGNEIRHHDAKKAARLAINVVTASCRDALVLKPPPRPSALSRTKSEFKQELTRVVLCYLQAGAVPTLQ